MPFRRKKDKKSQALDLLDSYLKLQVAKKATKDATKSARKATKRTPALRAVPVAIAGVAVATIVAVKKLRGGHGDSSPAAA
jgi:hypothetical protein